MKHTVPVPQHLSAGTIRAWSCALLKRNVRQDMRKTLMWVILHHPVLYPGLTRLYEGEAGYS